MISSTPDALVVVVVLDLVSEKGNFRNPTPKSNVSI